MFKLLTRTFITSPTLLRPVPSIVRSKFPIRTMATGKKDNEELKASKLFDVFGFSAVVTGGGTGIGLMM